MIFNDFRKLSQKEQVQLLQDKNFIENFAKELNAKEAQFVYKILNKADISNANFYDARRHVIDEKFQNKQTLQFEKPYELMNLLTERFLVDSVVNTQLNCDTIIEFIKDFPEVKDKIKNFSTVLEINDILTTAKTCENMSKHYDKLLEYVNEKENTLALSEKLNEAMSSATSLAAIALISELKLPNEKKEFAFFTHTHKCKPNLSKQEILEEWNNPTNVTREEISLCYISEKNPVFFPPSPSSVTFGFLELDSKNVKHISPTNCYSLSNAKFNQGLFSPQTFAEISYNYEDSSKEKNFNEIVYKKPKCTEGQTSSLMPNIIISQSDKPTPAEEQYAEAFGIPIIHINPLEYITNKNADITNKWNQERYQ